MKKIVSLTYVILTIMHAVQSREIELILNLLGVFVIAKMMLSENKCRCLKNEVLLEQL